MPKCFYCDEELKWRADYSYDDFNMDNDGIIHTYVCPKCGAEYEVYVSNENE